MLNRRLPAAPRRAGTPTPLTTVVWQPVRGHTRPLAFHGMVSTSGVVDPAGSAHDAFFSVTPASPCASQAPTVTSWEHLARVRMGRGGRGRVGRGVERDRVDERQVVYEQQRDAGQRTC